MPPRETTRDVTLQVDTRPVRLGVLVTNRTQLLEAVEFLTHVPGGLASGLIQLPHLPGEAVQFVEFVNTLDPDVLLLPKDLELSGDVMSLLGRLPCKAQRITVNDLSEHVELVNRLFLPSGRLPHVSRGIMEESPTRVAESAIRFVRRGSEFDFVCALQHGSPSERYANFLQAHAGARQYRQPRSVTELARLAILTNEFLGTLAVTLRGFRGRVDESASTAEGDAILRIARANDPRSLQLFLDDGGLEVPIAFWNVRRVSSASNKILLPHTDFLAEAAEVLGTVAEVVQYSDLTIASSGTREQAAELRAQIAEALPVSLRDIPVRIWYGGHRFILTPGRVFAGHREPINRSVAANGVIRFTAYPPTGHAQNGDAFGYDAALEFDDGRTLSLPRTSLTSALLTNEEWRLERRRADPIHGRHYLRHAPTVRVGRRGAIAGQVATGEQCIVVLHSPTFLFGQLLADQGIFLRPNSHTRYADGFVRRFGMSEALQLVRKGGDDIIVLLGAARAQQSGLTSAQLAGHLREYRGCTHQEALSIVDQFLPPLLAAGLVRRGYGLTCDQCFLNDWYGLQEFDELVECHGCGRRFQLDNHRKISFHYSPNELARRFIAEGGSAVLMAAAVLEHLDESGVLQFGGDLIPIGKTVPFAEADILWLTRDGLAIVECKAYEDLSRRRDEIADSLERGLTAAVGIGANILLLAVKTPSSGEDTRELVAQFVERGLQIGVAVHLILNGSLWVGGTSGEIREDQLRMVSVAALRVQPDGEQREVFEGGESSTTIVGGVRPTFDKAVLQAWDEAFAEAQPDLPGPTSTNRR